VTLKTIECGFLAVKGLPTYTCDGCGLQALGSTVSNETRTWFDMSEAGAQVRALLANVSNQHMPIGWASYGNGAHKCPRCAR
jgi:hypothetical protein